MSPDIITLLLQSALVLGLAFAVIAFALSRVRYETMASARSPEEQVELAVSEMHARRESPAAVVVVAAAGDGDIGPFRAVDRSFELGDGSHVWVLAADADRLGALIARLPRGRVGVAMAKASDRRTSGLVAQALKALQSNTQSDAVHVGTPGAPAERAKPAPAKPADAKPATDQSRLLDQDTGVLRSDRIGKVFPRFIRRARVRKRRASILHVALDRVQLIESHQGADALAHAVRHLSDLLQAHLREEDLIARLERTEFLACLEADAAGAEAAAKRLEQVVRENPCRLGGEAGGSLHLSVCIGVATEPEHGRSINQLLDASTHALNEARRVGAGTVRAFDESLLHRLDD